MNLDEILEQYKLLTVWHKAVKIMAAVLLAAMIGFIVWGLFIPGLRTMLIVVGCVFGACGVCLYIVVHRLYNKTGLVIGEYLVKFQGMSESEIEALLREKRLSLPGFSGKAK